MMSKVDNEYKSCADKNGQSNRVSYQNFSLNHCQVVESAEMR